MPGPTCSSEIGMMGGQQILHMNDECFRNGKRSSVHELMHTLGFVHEHTRNHFASMQSSCKDAIKVIQSNSQLIKPTKPKPDELILDFLIVSMLTLLRPDRDDFININEDNIEPGLKKNFVKRIFGTADYGVKGSVNTRNSPYDVKSEPKN